MNEFEKDTQSKTNDMVDNIKGFTLSGLLSLFINICYRCYGYSVLGS